MVNIKVLNILLVEDNPDHIELITSELAESQWIKGIQVTKDGQETLSFLRQLAKSCRKKEVTCPSLILLDLNIPKINGFAILHELKSDPHLKSIPVLVLTTSTSQEDIEKARELGANGYLVKSFFPPTLVEKVKKALSEESFTFFSNYK